MPLDADEVDGAMERFIRKKYQDGTLGEDRSRPQVRNEGSPPVPPKSPDMSPALRVPSKKGRFFGFGLRASSSAYPLSKHDKKKLPPEPRVESAFTIDSDDYNPRSRSSRKRASMSHADLERKLVQLRDMGFSDTERNTNMLRRLDGNVERTVEALVQLGPSIGQRASSNQAEPTSRPPPRKDANADSTFEAAMPTSRSSGTSNNPFDQPSGQGFGISMAPTQQAQSTGHSNNPFDQPPRGQTDPGLINSFQGLQISQPATQTLFPNSTGGYPIQQPPMMDPRLQSMTPPIQMSSQQYGYVASPSVMGSTTNPFFQQVQSQSTGSNPFFSPQQAPQQPQQQQFQQSGASNPFFSANNLATQANASSSAGPNPFGLPPSQHSLPQSSQRQIYQPPIGFTQSAAQSATAAFPPSNPFQQPSFPQAQAQQSPQLPNFHYGQPQAQQQQQQQQNPYGMPNNPYAALDQQQFAQQAPQQYQQASLMPQQTGRYDKNSIMALYNYPQLAPSQPQGLSSIPEPGHDSAPPQPDFRNSEGKRSATMPISMSSMHSAGGAGNVAPSRNPFFQNSAPPQMSPVPGQGIGARHVSQESININNTSGRHSPDAFASLSARYVR